MRRKVAGGSNPHVTPPPARTSPTTTTSTMAMGTRPVFAGQRPAAAACIRKKNFVRRRPEGPVHATARNDADLGRGSVPEGLDRAFFSVVAIEDGDQLRDLQLIAHA